jgi:hypothetical protein
MARKEKTEDGAVASAEKAAGKKPDKGAPPAAVAAPLKKPAKPKIPKLPAKNKSRLPRKQKKAQQKLAAAREK